MGFTRVEQHGGSRSGSFTHSIQVPDGISRLHRPQILPWALVEGDVVGPGAVGCGVVWWG